MARKRSLKDAAADRLVEKNNAVPEAPVVPANIPAAEPSAVQAIQVEPAKESPGVQRLLAEASHAPEGEKKGHPSLMWIAITLLIGCFGGYFFGVGQAIGPANMSLLLIGLSAGYFFGRFFKII
jgi:hypothetical protein